MVGVEAEICRIMFLGGTSYSFVQTLLVSFNLNNKYFITDGQADDSIMPTADHTA